MHWTTPNLGWIAITILIPLVLPFAGILAIKLAPAVPDSNLLNQVKDGQLNWLAAGLCAAALYEQREATEECMKYVIHSSSDIIPVYWDWLYGFLICSLCIAFLLASLGAVFITNIRGAGSSEPWWKYYKMYTASIFVTVAVTVQAIVVHGAASPGCTIYAKGFER